MRLVRATAVSRRLTHPLPAGAGDPVAASLAMAPTPELNRIVKRLGNHRLSKPQLRQLANLELEPVPCPIGQ